MAQRNHPSFSSRLSFAIIFISCTIWSMSQACELDFHMESPSLMLVAGTNTSVLCDATSCNSDSEDGPVKVIWRDAYARQIRRYPSQVFSISYNRGLMNRLIFLGATSHVSGTYICTVMRNDVVLEQRAVAVVVFGDDSNSYLEPDTGPRRGDITPREEINYRPVRSAHAWAHKQGPHPNPDYNVDPRSFNPGKNADRMMPRLPGDTEPSIAQTESVSYSAGSVDPSIWKDRSILNVFKTLMSDGENSENHADPDDDQWADADDSDQVIQNDIFMNNAYYDQRIPEFLRKFKRNLATEGFSEELQEAIIQEFISLVTSEYPSESEDEHPDPFGWLTNLPNFWKDLRHLRQKRETNDSAHSSGEGEVPESSISNGTSESTTDWSSASTAATDPSTEASKSPSSPTSSSNTTTEKLSTSTGRPGQPKQITTKTTSNAGGTGNGANDEAPDNPKQTTPCPKAHTKLTTFGEYGILAFSICLAVAFLLLYAILMIIFMPRILSKRSVLDKSDEEAATYRKKASDAGELAPLTLMADDPVTSDTETDLERHNTTDLDKSGSSDGDKAEENKQAEPSGSGTVSSFLLKQSSETKTDDELAKEKEAGEVADKTQTPSETKPDTGADAKKPEASHRRPMTKRTRPKLRAAMLQL